MSSKNILKPRILVVDDSSADVVAMHSALDFSMNSYEVICAQSISEANDLVLESLKNGERFSVALVELNVGGDSGSEFARRLMDIVVDINVVIVTANYDRAAILSFQPDGILVKGANSLPTSISNMERQTLTETVGGLIEPKRKVTDPLDVRINKWIATKDMFGINDLKPFTHVFIGGQEKQVEKITSSAIDRRWVNSVIYPEHPGDNSIPCGVQTTLGCPVGCLFCINWRTQKDKNGHSMRFVRRLTAGEMMSQVYQSMTTGQRLRNLFGFDSKVGLTVNFTGAGDGLVYNLHNCVLVIKQLAKIEKPQVSFIMTSVGSERQLQVYLDRYTYLPRVTHYWSVNFLNLRKRDLFMPGTKGQSLKNMRDLYARISDRTGKMVTASFALFKGINNKEEDADKIASFFKNQPFKIKLMAGCPGSLNGVPDITNEEVATFHKMVVDAGIDPDRVRDRIIFGSGDGENSGCGRTEASFIINGRV